MLELAVRLEGGFSIPPDIKASQRWLEEAVHADCMYAQFMMAAHYFRGKFGHAPDRVEGVALLKKSATAGNVAAQLWLGRIIAAGLTPSKKKNRAAALKWLEKAASQPVLSSAAAEARFELGQYYDFRGKTGDADKWHSLAWDYLEWSGDDAVPFELGLRITIRFKLGMSALDAFN